MMAAASTTPNLRRSSSERRSWRNSTTTTRPSENGNDVGAQRRLKPSTREVNSQFRSTSSVNKRSQSAERRLPVTPTPVNAVIGAEISSAAKVLMSSKRILSLSFQGESLLTPTTKTKPLPQPNFGKATAERRTKSAAMSPRIGELRENARSAEQRPWPAGSRQINSVKPLSKSVDLVSDRKKLISRSGNVVRSLKPSHADRIDRLQCDDKLQGIMSNSVLLDDDNGVPSSNLLHLTNLSISAVASATSDRDSNFVLNANAIMRQIQPGCQGVIVPARVWELTKNQIRRMAEPSPPLCISSSLKATISLSSPSRLNTKSSPLQEPLPSRTMASPVRVRKGVVGSSGSITCGVPSLLCFAADSGRGKLGQNRISDAHLLRLLCNRHLQWRFANSRAEATLSFQSLSAERNLYNTWKAMSDLRLSICNWRLELSRLSLKVKLFSILKEQKWAAMEKDYVSSLLGAAESFSASTIQLPFVCGAKVDILNLKDVICSAVNVLQAMASSICSLILEVEKINSVLDELVSIGTSEQALINVCKDLLSAIAVFQVKDCSLRAQISQLKRASTSVCLLNHERVINACHAKNH
ncbi:hypothetical protein V2J09_007121 [Rumex salicifolius]